MCRITQIIERFIRTEILQWVQYQGESALVRRQIYEVLKRQSAAEVLDSEKLIFFQNDQAVGSGFKVQFLASYLENQAPFVLTEEGNGKAIGCALDLPAIQMKLTNC